ncbi:UV DNA damage repair endonuclease UvsE [Acetivibrio clariflavus]|uniref:UV-damage endonuclease n=1 Tax=Acetivibrio clariflavus (strain DSM 19732 / NBRC 101661 / EBR45) TaxID=720554 RepID=G8LTV5_ACECE|nr:UV DNA damage repair endonuclease UvsE [Acetivibrio clariflavus]AEV67301.1 UV-damage endonuclease [Acetivibrio clariflavus DSM 19732]HOQ00614.1 UV DNA damage repair endonuclease UvsE [Acetivibrio clariflavus]HPU41964.1 UV DNA damage repair endonuclease UvsE [Acetivibrio clariflavus]
MLVRLGYVAMTLNLENCSPSGTVTVKTFSKLASEEAKLHRLRRITRENLNNTLRILRFNKAYNIEVYRLTSKLVPLATHPDIGDWDYVEEFKDEFKKIGQFIKENDFRISAHPDHYTLINTSNDKVFEASLKDLDYHIKLFEAMGLDDYKYKLVMHIGGVYKNKEASIEKFKENFMKLPDRIRKRLILENDDKAYTAKEVLEICKDVRAPMVLDVHHHYCVNNGEAIEDMLQDIFETWKGEYFVPKIHFSSPKSQKEFRSHADDIDPNEFYNFLKIAKKLDADFDVMIEAKNKDNALFNLSNKLKGFENIRWIDEGHFEVL